MFKDKLNQILNLAKDHNERIAKLEKEKKKWGSQSGSSSDSSAPQ